MVEGIVNSEIIEIYTFCDNCGKKMDFETSNSNFYF